MTPIKPPFPWFGGKSRAAPLIWERFGDVANYVEPFFGSGAVLFGRPHPAKTETVNDADCFLANFWRAVSIDPDTVADYADWPVNEADQHARHLWLVNNQDFIERMKTDPEFFDAKVAGWWVWGQSIWIGSGWCSGATPKKRQHLGNAGTGVHRQLPHLGDAGTGINRQGAVGSVHEYMRTIAARLRKVRVCCGDWSRVTGPSVTVKHGVTGVILDPPYGDEAKRQGDLYAVDSGDIAAAVRQWAIENGDQPLLRIALCGYDGEHEMPEGWDCVWWKARGGYGSQGEGAGRENAARERIWFSPHCLKNRLF